MKNNKEVVTIIYDIETSPHKGMFFDLYREGNILWVEEYGHILSVSWKKLGEKKSHVIALPDFATYKKYPNNDKELVGFIWNIFNQADILVAHNGNSFDQKMMNARFIKYGFQPPQPYHQIDTKLIAKRYFRFLSNKLDDLADFLGIGRKLETEKGLWKKCLEGDIRAWKYMKEYNKQDVILLEKVYLHLLPWITNHPNLGILRGERSICPNCSSKDLQSRGIRYGKRQWFCNGCGSWHTSLIKDDSQIR